MATNTTGRMISREIFREDIARNKVSTEELLGLTWDECKIKLVTLRDSLSVPGVTHTKEEVAKVFKGLATWFPITTKDGHVHFKQIITQKHIGVQNHAAPELPQKQLRTVLEQLEEHFDLVHRVFFAQTGQPNFQGEVDLRTARENYETWRSTQKMGKNKRA